MKCETCGLELPEQAAACPVCSPDIQKEAPAQEPAAPAAEPVPAEVPVAQPAPVPAQPAVQPVEKNSRPALQLPVRRGMLKYFLLMLPTLFIYPLVIMSRISSEINIVASRYDGKRTMNFLGMTLLAPLTLSIYVFVWFHKLSNRIGDELRRRGISYKFSAGSYWLFNIFWAFLVTLINVILTMVLTASRALDPAILTVISVALGIVGSCGMFIYFHKLFKAMNLINADYNEKG